MITEDYVSFETAKLLKEKGFDEATHQYYRAITYLGTEANSICIKSLDGIEDEPFHNSVYGFDFKGEDSGEYACPTLQMTMKWLRKNYNIHIEPRYFPMPNIYRYVIIHSSFTNKNIDSHPQYFNTYEEACECAIRYCLENLI